MFSKFPSFQVSKLPSFQVCWFKVRDSGKSLEHAASLAWSMCAAGPFFSVMHRPPVRPSVRRSGLSVFLHPLIGGNFKLLIR